MASDKPTVVASPLGRLHIRLPGQELVECRKFVSPDADIEHELADPQVFVEPAAQLVAFCPNCLGAYLARLTARNAELEARIATVESWTGAAEPEVWERFVERVGDTLAERAEAELHHGKEGEES